MEDQLRTQLARWRERYEAGSDFRCPENVLAVLLPELHSLNTKYFASSAQITGTLKTLELAVQQGDPVSAWEAFLALAERPGKNFGTWAI